MRFPAVASQYERIQWMRAISEAEFYPFPMPPSSVHNDRELRNLICCWLFYVLKQQRELGRIAWRERLALWLLRIKKEAK